MVRSTTRSRSKSSGASRSRASRSPCRPSTCCGSDADPDARVEVAGDEAPRLGTEGGFLGRAPCHRVRAARVEAAAARRRERARHLARHDDLVPLLVGVGRQRRREERLGIGVPGCGGDGLGGADLDDLPEVHHRDRVAHVRDGREVVRDEEVRQAEPALEVAEQVQDLGADRDVQSRHRLVEHDELRLERERPRDRDPLPLPARELVGKEVGGARRQADHLEGAGDPRPRGAGRRQFVWDEGIRDDRADAQPRIERGVGVLEDGLHGSAVRAQRVRVERLEVPALEADRARRGRFEMQHELRGRRLAAPRLTDDAEGPAGLDRERDPVHGAHDAGPASEETALDREVLGEVPGLQDRGGHRRSPASQQRAVWPSPTATSGGASCRQRSSTRGHRGWNGQPAGGFAGSGGCPSMAVRRSRPSPSLGIDSRRAWVYGWAGALKIWRIGPASTIRPAYITATRSHILATIPRLWVMKIIARWRARCRSRSRFRYCAWMVTSRLVVGSSAIKRRGSHEIAIAPTMRWRIPPDIWCGYSRTRSSGAAIRTARRSSLARTQALPRLAPSWTRIDSATGSPIVKSGLSEAIGSCRIIAIRLPRILRIWAAGFRSRSSPSNRTSPATIRAAGGRSLRSESASVVLPERDSPTMPSVSPSRRANDARSTARVARVSRAGRSWAAT